MLNPSLLPGALIAALAVSLVPSEGHAQAEPPEPEPAPEPEQPEQPADEAPPAAPPAPYAPRPMAPPEAPPQIRRSGFVAGLAVGLGSLSTGEGESDGTLNYSLQFGGFLTDRLAILVELWGGDHDAEGFQMKNRNRGVAAQYWFGPSFWLKGGAGTADLEINVDDLLISEFTGASLNLAVGWVFYERVSYHVDAQFGVTLEGFRDTRNNATATAFLVGLQYY